MSENIITIIVVVAILSIGVLIGIPIGQAKRSQPILAEIVKRGFAEYVIVDNYGKTEFRWIEAKSE